MSRLKKFTYSILSGYAVLGANIFYTLASGALALHYLSMKEIGLWALVSQMANFNVVFMDLGMSGSLSRILIDHKDDKESTNYGTVIQTGALVLLVQACLIAVVGAIISIWLPEWMKVEEKFQHIFQQLMIFQCVALGATFAGRIFSFILTAHQRYDIYNYANIGGFVVNLFTLWLGFECHWGLYSLLTSAFAGSMFSIVLSVWAVRRLGFLPAKNNWGKPNRATFHELFMFGTDVFLLSIGQQLISFSAIPVISRTMGLDAVAVWSYTTKVFTLAQQLVYRIYDFSGGALAEMLVRGETERLKKRFGDVTILTGLAAAGVGTMLALCNESFVAIWTHGRIAWHPLNNALMAVSFFIYASVRLSIGLVAMTKKIGFMKFIYFFEGAAFVILGLLLAPHWGFPGIIVSGILTDLFFSGAFGMRRTLRYFDMIWREMFEGWLLRSLVFFGISGMVALGLWFITRHWSAPLRLAANATLFGLIILIPLWRTGLPEYLRSEITSRLKGKIYGRKNV
jgi:O-antigen/teichoic acid export membrane protein